MGDITTQISQTLMKHGRADKVEYCGNITGGISNKAGLFSVDGKDVFVKYSTRANAFQMFASEKESLQLIAKTNTIRVPSPGDVYSLPGVGGACFDLEYLPGLTPVTTVWAALGEQVARLHKYNTDLVTKSATSSIHQQQQSGAVTKFGFDQPIHIGTSEVLQSVWEEDWLTFITRYQLEPRLQKIEEKTGDAEFREIWSELQLLIHKPFSDLTVLPSIIHGDFCTINVGQCNDQPVLFDPGCYYGHSEIDFIIPALEENFPPEFFDAYHKVLPKKSRGFAERQALYVFSANCMIYMSEDQEGYRDTALKSGHHLLQLLRQYT